jgi:hypothetical protein
MIISHSIGICLARFDICIIYISVFGRSASDDECETQIMTVDHYLVICPYVKPTNLSKKTIKATIRVY